MLKITKVETIKAKNIISHDTQRVNGISIPITVTVGRSFLFIDLNGTTYAVKIKEIVDEVIHNHENQIA